MADIKVLGFKALAMTPGDVIFIDPGWHAVITDRHDFMIVIDDARAHLGGWVFGT